MRTSWCLGILAATLVSGAASATEIVVGESRLVIDVEFWGRTLGFAPGPIGRDNEDIPVFGDPVHGTFRIFADDAPPPQNTRGETFDGKTYGEDTFGRQLPSGASFVTSRWLSPLPSGSTHQVSPFPGSVPNDFVVIGDKIQFETGQPTKDWLRVSDQFSPNSVEGRRHELRIQMRSSLDVIDGFGLDQEFEIADLVENDGISNQGFFRGAVGGAQQFMSFVVDRIRVSPRVCKP